MSYKLRFYRFLSVYVWGSLPGIVQRKVSAIYTTIYNKRFSKLLIKPYVRLNYNDPNYLEKFRPASGGSYYQNFQDFFIRVFKDPLNIRSSSIWACEGLLCEYGQVAAQPLVSVKGEKRNLKTIFGEGGSTIPDDYYFSNVFLHNTNYHRIHAPVSGEITRIEHIPGDLVLLRPWIYQNDPSLPALRNERVNVDIKAPDGQTWFLSIVGGPAVGTIVMAEHAGLGSIIEIGQELATFLLGSTCCIASPKPVDQAKVGDQVEVGHPY